MHSYRELPIRIAEIGMMHRYEKSGALTGLQRVREMSLNDGHTFVTPEQIKDEFQRTLQLIIDVYEDFLLSNWTSCFQNALTLNTSVLMGKNTVQL